ncbi:hypothetical protein ES703_40671 [subsurface metagenome]
MVLSHHRPPPSVPIKYQNPQNEAPIAGIIKYQYPLIIALVAIKAFVGPGNKCSLPAKMAVNRGRTKHNRKIVTDTAITAMIIG